MAVILEDIPKSENEYSKKGFPDIPGYATLTIQPYNHAESVWLMPEGIEREAQLRGPRVHREWFRLLLLRGFKV